MDERDWMHGFHYKGQTEQELLTNFYGSSYKGVKQFYRHVETTLKNKKINKKTINLSDEFVNEQIPQDLSNFVTWKDIVAFGMIPELRDIPNEHLREDIQCLNQCFEAPSPEPAPEPVTSESRSEIVIEAKAVKNNVISCKKVDEKIIIIYKDNEKDVKYTFEIVKDSDFWNQYGIYFQNNLVKCYDVLMMTFTWDECNVKWKIKEKKEKNIILNISCEDMVFGFSIDIVLDLEEKHIEKLEKKVQELEKKVESKVKHFNELEDKVRSLCEYITYKETVGHWSQTGPSNLEGYSEKLKNNEPLRDFYCEREPSGIRDRQEVWRVCKEQKGWIF